MTQHRKALVPLLYLLLLAGATAVYFPTRHFEFVIWDDNDMVAANPVLHPPQLQGLSHVWNHAVLGLYTPLAYSLWWVLAKFSGGVSPVAFHLLNVSLHLAASALVFSILRKTLRNDLAAFAGAALFALHPLQVEPVAWVSGMNTVLAGALSLAAIRLFLQFQSEPSRRRWFFYAAGLILFLLALFSKPTAVVTPVLALLLGLWQWPQSRRRILLASVPWFCLSIVFAIIARYVQPATTVAALPLWQRPAIAVTSLVFYIEKLFWPWPLVLDYGYLPPLIWQSRQWVTDCALLIGFIVILWLNRQNTRGLAIGALLFVAGLIPVLGLVPFDFQKFSTVADRYVYIAMLGPALMLGGVLAQFQGIIARSLAAAVLLALACGSAVQVKVWTNVPLLVEHTLSVDRQNVAGNILAGFQFSAQNNPTMAADAFERALLHDPGEAEVHYDLGNAYLHLNRYDEAIVQYQAALNLHQNRVRALALYNLANTYILTRQFRLAELTFNQYLQIDPTNPTVLNGLHYAQSQQVQNQLAPFP